MQETIKRAAIARGFLHRGEREADGIGKVLLPKNDAPEWFTDLCREAHDSAQILPDDWRYEFIGDAIDFLADADPDSDENDIRDGWNEHIDGCYVYTGEKTSWLASRTDRYSYCDEAVEEFGGEPGSIMDQITLGMMREQSEVFESVFTSLQAADVEA